MSIPSTSFLPNLPPGDVEQAAQLIQQALAPQTQSSSQDQRKLQQELFDIQKRPESWGLVIPFLQHSDPNVQFFGAHTMQVKIARDWDLFPHEHDLELRDLLVAITGHSIVAGYNKVILRKLFVAITSLALKFCTQIQQTWPEWPASCIQSLSALGASTEPLLDLLAIIAEEVDSADLLAPQKTQMRRMLSDAVPLVMQAISSCVSRPRPHPSPNELRSALKCFEAWLPNLPANDISPLIPQLIEMLKPIPGSNEFDEDEFTMASDSLQEIMSKSALSDGAGSKCLTEPLLLWCEQYGTGIVDHTINEGYADSVSRSLCKLLSALGDHSTQYFASHLASTASVTPVLPQPITTPLPSKSRLVQTFLRLLMAYTGIPGYYGVDEEESEMTLGFWYLFQESLWSVGPDPDEDEEDSSSELSGEQWNISKAVYSELIQVLRRKSVWPPKDVLQGWPRDQKDKFQAYRRDVGDTLLNAYYILRGDLLAFYVNDLAQRLSQPHPRWEEIEATLHCIMSVQEGVPIEDNPHLVRLFGPEILGRLPTSGSTRVRRTAVLLIGAYATWFTTQYTQPPGSGATSLLMNAISYVVSALPEAALCLPAANSLRDLCDANRTALAPHISAFGELHAGLINIPDTEKGKVLQSIASVIQALPPDEEIPPIEAIVNPVVAKLYQALQSSVQLPDEARALVYQQLQIITGVARGLTRTNDSLLIFDDSPDVKRETELMRRAREDSRTIRLRESIFDGVRKTVEIWSTDATISYALSELFKAITSLPTDVTLLSLSPGPLLELICVAAQKQLTAVWLSLATMLIVQLNPPTLLPTTFKTVPTSEARIIVLNVLVSLLQTSLTFFSEPGSMKENPEIVQAFFNSLETVAQHFVSVFYQLPPELFDTLIQCAIGSLALQERYALVASCTFLVSLINRTAAAENLDEAKNIFAQKHGKNIMHAILSGFAAVAPRTATPNLIELLSTFITRYPIQSKEWINEILYSPDFCPSKATNEAKDKFMKTIFNSRSLRRTREAAQQFILVARGLEGTSFGYSSVTM
ncbi:ARM repeat-containing protein [Irpex rosettiformis]|uniref:ARM repeat-containing protein n=1 Tax=Irpex rosettiformis TaxID=378272 RepID=A0ACB8TZJ0_9APHY|nr:ARM repeat-containing protein [Irpex rosettiformis]